MKFILSSPDSLMFDRNEFKREKSKTEHVAVSVLALVAVASQVFSFIMLKNLMDSMV